MAVLRQPEVAQRRGQDVVDLVERVVDLERVLEDRLDLAPVLAGLGPVHLRDVDALVDDLAAGRLDEAEQQAGHRRLAAAGLAGDRGRGGELAGDDERRVAQGDGGARRGLADAALEDLRDVAQLEQRRAHRQCLLAMVLSSRSDCARPVMPSRGVPGAAWRALAPRRARRRAPPPPRPGPASSPPSIAAERDVHRGIRIEHDRRRQRRQAVVLRVEVARRPGGRARPPGGRGLDAAAIEGERAARVEGAPVGQVEEGRRQAGDADQLALGRRASGRLSMSRRV